VGTNTVRLLIIQPEGKNSYRQVYQEQEITRLGEGVARYKRLQPQAMQRTLAVLQRFALRAREYGAERIYAVATSAVRESPNGSEFAKEVKASTGFDLNIIPPEKEAELALKGILSVSHPANGQFVAMDIGGGSTEFILASREGKPLKWVSLDLGVVKLKEMFIKQDPPSEGEYLAMCEYIRLAIAPVDFIPQPAPALIGNAGTVTTLAAIDQQMANYDPQHINNYELRYPRIKAMQQRFLSLPLPERRKIAGLEPMRADVIIAGAAVVLEVMDKFGYQSLLACDSGLREGIILDILAKSLTA